MPFVLPATTRSLHSLYAALLLPTVAMRASHILVKHQGSRRTASWKDVDGVDIKTRTKVRLFTPQPGERAVTCSMYVCLTRSGSTAVLARVAFSSSFFSAPPAHPPPLPSLPVAFAACRCIVPHQRNVFTPKRSENAEAKTLQAGWFSSRRTPHAYLYFCPPSDANTLSRGSCGVPLSIACVATCPSPFASPQPS